MPELTAPLVWSASSLRRAIEAAGVALWSWHIETDRLELDDASYVMWGVVNDGEVTFEDLSSHIHPADRDRVRAAFYATRAVLGSFEIDFRILVENEVKWISARGQGGDPQDATNLLFGIFLDVTGRKQAEESHELLAGNEPPGKEPIGYSIRPDFRYFPLHNDHR